MQPEPDRLRSNVRRKHLGPILLKSFILGVEEGPKMLKSLVLTSARAESSVD